MGAPKPQKRIITSVNLDPDVYVFLKTTAKDRCGGNVSELLNRIFDGSYVLPCRRKRKAIVAAAAAH